MIFSITIKEVIVVVMMEDVYLGLKIPATLTFKIVDKSLMLIGEVGKVSGNLLSLT